MPRWGVVTAVAAPVLLAAGWTIAARLQPDGFDPVSQTISELAADDATDQWVMTAAIIGTGVAQIATAISLRPVPGPGRLLLATGGVFTILIALNPLPAGGEGSTAHAVVAAGSFGALALWPFVSWRSGDEVPWALRRGVAIAAGAGLVAATAWFFRGVLTESANVGLVERVDALLLNLWPLVVATSIRSAYAHRGSRG